MWKPRGLISLSHSFREHHLPGECDLKEAIVLTSLQVSASKEVSTLENQAVRTHREVY